LTKTLFALKYIFAARRRFVPEIILDIPTSRVSYLQFPEFFFDKSLRARRKTAVLPGDWDQEIGREVYWSSKYEPSQEHERGMVPLEKYVFFRSAAAHFHRGVPWRETEWYDWILRASPRRYENALQITERLAFIDRLYEDACNGLFVDNPNSLPLINMGRESRVSIDDGRHRICIARLAQVDTIRVKVKVAHPDYIAANGQ